MWHYKSRTDKQNITLHIPLYLCTSAAISITGRSHTIRTIYTVKYPAGFHACQNEKLNFYYKICSDKPFTCNT